MTNGESATTASQKNIRGDGTSIALTELVVSGEKTVVLQTPAFFVESVTIQLHKEGITGNITIGYISKNNLISIVQFGRTFLSYAVSTFTRRRDFL